jgi:N-acetylmuramoyl-L-alanine amidase
MSRPNRIDLSTAVLTSLLFLGALREEAQAYSLKVLVDPGHGGSDHGAVTKLKDGQTLTESTITLGIAKELAELSAADERLSVQLTRTKDGFLSLDDRSRLANQKNVDVFISIHVNSSEDPEAQGKEIYFQNQLPPDEESLYLASLENKGSQVTSDEEAPTAATSDIAAILFDLKRTRRIFLSSQLSEMIHRNWLAPAAPRKRPIRQAPFHVISNVQMPSVLVEVGYLSNSTEALRLKTRDHQQKVAEGLLASLREFARTRSHGSKDFIDKKTARPLD